MAPRRILHFLIVGAIVVVALRTLLTDDDTTSVTILNPLEAPSPPASPRPIADRRFVDRPVVDILEPVVASPLPDPTQLPTQCDNDVGVLPPLSGLAHDDTESQGWSPDLAAVARADTFPDLRFALSGTDWKARRRWCCAAANAVLAAGRVPASERGHARGTSTAACVDRGLPRRGPPGLLRRAGRPHQGERAGQQL